jgi:integrase
MLCIKCHKDIPDGSLYCNHCGKKQTVTKSKTHKRLSGSGTISRDNRYKNPWIAHGPATAHGAGRKYLGAYATRAEAQAAIDDFLKRGRPDLYNATLQQIYDLWSAQHYKDISRHQEQTYHSMWKRFKPIAGIKIAELRAADFQSIVDTAASASAAAKIQAISSSLCSYALENDIIIKDYSQFVKMPHFEKHEKKPFSKEDISKLWAHSDDERVQAVLIMIYTGFRIGEIVTLKKSDIHLDEGYMIGGEKTEAGRNRIVPIPPGIPEISDFISAQLRRTEKGRLYHMSVQHFRDSVFYPALETAGITEKYTPHSTRHTFASLSAEAGMRPENLQKIIGHADFSTTANIYVHQDIDALKNEMAKLKK